MTTEERLELRKHHDKKLVDMLYGDGRLYQTTAKHISELADQLRSYTENNAYIDYESWRCAMNQILELTKDSLERIDIIRDEIIRRFACSTTLDTLSWKKVTN